MFERYGNIRLPAKYSDLSKSSAAKSSDTNEEFGDDMAAGIDLYFHKITNY